MTYNTTIRLGTRKSPLALVQAGEVRARLMAAHPGIAVELVPMITSGDTFQGSLADTGGKGLFTKEIEEALLAGAIDIAVHSMKDMPTVLPDRLIIGAMLEREDPRDMLIGAVSFGAIPKGSALGTSALRRAAQVLMKRPDLTIVPLRGNVETRLRKLGEGNMSATLLAMAGLKRLGLTDIPGAVLSVEDFLPAVAQGAIGIECRENDAKIRELLSAIAHAPTETAVACERAFLKRLDGSCRTPIAGYAEIKSGELFFRGLIARPDGSAHHAVEIRGNVADAEALGEEAGNQLLAKAGKNFI